MFVNEFTESREFGLGKGIHGTNWRCSTFLKVYFEIVWPMGSKGIGFLFAKNISKIMIFFGNTREVRDLVWNGS